MEQTALEYFIEQILHPDYTKIDTSGFIQISMQSPTFTHMVKKAKEMESQEMESQKTKVYPVTLTERGYFAAMALQGLLANNNQSFLTDNAIDAVKLADALIQQLKKTF